MKVLITGSSGLIGSEAVLWFDGQGHSVLGIDNNMRRDFFGERGDTTWMLRRLLEQTQRFTHCPADIRDREAMLTLWQDYRPELIIHCAAQPSHDLAATRPLDDFDVNAVGTMNVLEATRRFAPDAVFILMSTNKVYGDAPNALPLAEYETRYDYSDPADYNGIKESLSIDQCLHSVFGASKVAADVMAQEYGRYFGLKVGVFRGGCLTGEHHSAVQLHGFLSYLFKVARAGETYTIFGYKGKQVRDQIHSSDVLAAFAEFTQNPRPGEVYNLGGGRQNSASILECIEKIQALLGKKVSCAYLDQPRAGDHICYITDLGKFKSHYPHWAIRWSLDQILSKMLQAAP